MPAAGSVYITDPVGPTMPEMVSDGSPLPPPISSTLWPTPIRVTNCNGCEHPADKCTILVPIGRRSLPRLDHFVLFFGIHSDSSKNLDSSPFSLCVTR